MRSAANIERRALNVPRRAKDTRQTVDLCCSTLAFIPFFTPINFFQTWWVLLAVPLAVGISMVYKAMRYRDPRNYWRQVGMMSTQIVIGMAIMMILLFVLVDVIVPLL